MDITQGEFKDFYPSSNGRNSRTQSRLSTNGSVCSSLELLSPEDHHSTAKFSSHLTSNGNSSQFDESDNETLSSVQKYDALNMLNQIGTNSKKFLSSSLSDNSAVSSSSDTESYETLKPESDIDPLQMQLSQEELDMQKAIKKMQKLDQILMSKMKHEREVKRQRLLIQKNFYSDLEKLEAESKTASYSDITNNTSKYLALLPPSQQLDVLLEQHQATDDFEPIFQTQLYSTHSRSSVEQTSEKVESERQRPQSEDKSEFREKSKRSKKTRSAGTKSNHKDNGKTNFIERNIELAKDAGSMVAMTEEEKKRLEKLLEDTAEDDLLLEDQESDTPSQLMAARFGVGFTPERKETEHLQEIDSRLKTLLSPAVFSSISSSFLMHRAIPNTSSEMRDIGRKIAKANVAETLTPEQRLNEIEDRLSSLNEKWKEKCDVMRPRLSDEQLHRLLDEYSRSTSPNSIVTSNLSKLDFRHDDRSSPISFVSNPSEIPRSSSDLPSPKSRCSSRSSDVTLTSERDSVVSKPPVLERSVLQKLLCEAKQSLGIADAAEDVGVVGDSANSSSSNTPEIGENT